jgi:hypothetical protein
MIERSTGRSSGSIVMMLKDAHFCVARDRIRKSTSLYGALPD